MRKFCAVWDSITLAVLAVAIILKVIFAFSWWWIAGTVGVIVVAEIITTIILRKKIFS